MPVAPDRMSAAEFRQQFADVAKAAGRVARGRKQPDGMNQTEAAYAVHLAERAIAGQVAWFAFEAIKLRLAVNTFYIPDFFVMLTSGELEVHEVKGHWEEDARVKIKVAAEKYPFRFLAVKKAAKRDGGGFSVEVFE